MCKPMEVLWVLFARYVQAIYSWERYFHNGQQCGFQTLQNLWSKEISSWNPMHKSMCFGLKRKAGKINLIWLGSTLGLLWEALQKPRCYAIEPTLKWPAVLHPSYSLPSCFVSFLAAIIILLICSLSESSFRLSAVWGQVSCLQAHCCIPPPTAEPGT